ncbi:MAG TPA: phage capsid protein [Anaerolineae bacterium]|nr:phage capsid protein [Anaerolineae bacterium]
MSFQVTEAFVTQFRDGLTLRAQQFESRLRDWFRVESGINGTSASFDFVGSRTPTKRQSRHADTKLSDTPHDRRWVDLAVYDDADLIDKPDLVRTLTDPTNTYTKAMASGMGRKIDEVGLVGALGTTRTGVDGAGTQALPAAQIPTLAAAMSLTEMLIAKGLFDAAEQPETRYWAVTSDVVQDMLGMGTVQSIDTNVMKPLAEGGVTAFMGFMFRRVETPIIARTATEDRTVAWAEGAIALGIGADISASIDRRPDKNNSTQVFYSMDIGAARMDDQGVIEYQFTF